MSVKTSIQPFLAEIIELAQLENVHIIIIKH